MFIVNPLVDAFQVPEAPRVLRLYCQMVSEHQNATPTGFFLRYPFLEKPLFVQHGKLLQEIMILFPKSLLPVMLFLV